MYKLTAAAVLLLALADARRTPAECALEKCPLDAVACLADPDCEGKAVCALSCETRSCVEACGGDSPSGPTESLINCVINNGCVSDGKMDGATLFWMQKIKHDLLVFSS